MEPEELAVKVAEIDQRSKSNTHRLDKMEETVDTLRRLTAAVEIMASEQKHQSATMTEIKTDMTALGQKVDTIEKKPAKRWETMVGQVIVVVVAALVGAVLARLGIG